MNVGKRDCEEPSPEFGGKIKRTRSVYRFVVGTQHLPVGAGVRCLLCHFHRAPRILAQSTWGATGNWRTIAAEGVQEVQAVKDAHLLSVCHFEREQMRAVKQGKLAIADAMNRVDPECKTYGWLKRRLARLQAEKKGADK